MVVVISISHDGVAFVKQTDQSVIPFKPHCLDVVHLLHWGCTLFHGCKAGIFVCFPETTTLFLGATGRHWLCLTDVDRWDCGTWS